MAQYKITLTVTTENKAPRRGQRETLRYRFLKLLQDEPQAIRRSLTVKRVV
jgi:hypothetical protein